MEPNHHQLRVAVVLGSAPSADEELNLLPFTYDVIAVNQAGLRYRGRLEAWVTLHANELDDWAKAREELGLEPPRYYATHGRGSFAVPVQIIRSNWPGSSGLFAVQWALEVGRYDRVILCGVHLNGDTRKDADGELRPAPMNYSRYQAGWIKAHHRLGGRVASMGGWTRELLGAPDDDFWSIL
jgi:hypothetical protein